MKNINQFIYSATLMLLLGVTTVSAQNKIGMVRYDDDFSNLKNDTLRKGLDNLKYIHIGTHNFISFGGELREQLQNYDNINFGDVPTTYTSSDATQLWHRLMVHTILS